MLYHWPNYQETRKINAFGVFGGPSNNLYINYVVERATRIKKSNGSRNRDIQNEEIQP